MGIINLNKDLILRQLLHILSCAYSMQLNKEDSSKHVSSLQVICFRINIIEHDEGPEVMIIEPHIDETSASLEQTNDFTEFVVQSNQLEKLTYKLGFEVITEENPTTTDKPVHKIKISVL